jgi:hypothetical protein
VRILVDDQLALLANLGILDLPASVEAPLLTVYSFQLRIASALAVERATEGVLQRLVHDHLPPGVDRSTLSGRESRILRVVDPTLFATEVAQVRAEMRCDTLAAEVVAVARSEMAEVRLTPGNAKGQLWDVLAAAGVPVAVWTVVTRGAGVAAVEDTGGHPQS